MIFFDSWEQTYNQDIFPISKKWVCTPNLRLSSFSIDTSSGNEKEEKTNCEWLGHLLP